MNFEPVPPDAAVRRERLVATVDRLGERLGRFRLTAYGLDSTWTGHRVLAELHEVTGSGSEIHSELTIVLAHRGPDDLGGFERSAAGPELLVTVTDAPDQRLAVLPELFAQVSARASYRTEAEMSVAGDVVVVPAYTDGRCLLVRLDQGQQVILVQATDWPPGRIELAPVHDFTPYLDGRRRLLGVG